MAWLSVNAGGTPDARLMANIYTFEDGFLYAGPRASGGTTRRQPITVLLSTSGQPLLVRAGGSAMLAIAAAIAPNVERSFILHADGVVSLNIEPSHPCYKLIASAIDKPAVRLDESVFAIMRPTLADACSGTMDRGTGLDAFNEMIAITGKALGTVDSKRDCRISRLIGALRDQPPADYEFAKICQTLRLSPGRLSHLFTAETGLSIRSFMAWRKTKEALVRLPSRKSITEVAYEVGFSDSAHLTRTFTSTIGILPSNIGCEGRESLHR